SLLSASLHSFPTRRSSDLNQRMDAFMDLVVGRLGFNDKLSILERLPYRKKYLALKSLTHIRQLQQARNRLAHDHYLHEADNKLRSEEHTSELQSPDHLVCR